jgi:phage baseplate assembly protein W
MGMNSGDGRSLTGNDHIRQSITDILATPLGSRVMRRDYGSLIPALIDQPLNNANLLRLYSAAVVAIAQWEPRVKINRVTRAVSSAGQATLSVEATRSADGSQQRFDVPIGGA